MTRKLLAVAGAAALAFSLPATAALADGYARRAPVAKPKPKAKPVVRHAPRPQAKRHAPPKHHPPKQHYAATVDYMERETLHTSYYEERNGQVFGPVVHYSERTIAPSQGCYPQAPCGYSTGAPHGVGLQHGFGHGPLTGGVGFGVDGGPIYSGRLFHHGPDYSGYSRSGSSYRSHSSTSSYGHGAYGYGHPNFSHPGAAPAYGYGHSYGGSFGSSSLGSGVGASGYTGFQPSPHGHGAGAQGYTGFQSVQPGRGYYNYGGR